MALERGVLVVRKKGEKIMVQVQIGEKLFNPPRGELSRPISEAPEKFDGVGGQPRKVREVGKEFIPPQTEPARSTPRQDLKGRPRKREAAPAPRSQSSAPSGYRFHNPYNFIPAPPRETSDPDLGDHAPPFHDEFMSGCYTGRLRVKMTAVTPLILLDTDVDEVEERRDGHKVFDVRVDEDERPQIPASSIRGMLRAAYEAITNSRFGIFSRKWQTPLAFRMDAKEGLKLIPARIENGKVRLLLGTSSIGEDGKPSDRQPLYAAWLPRYTPQTPLRYPDGSLPEHGDEVECWVRLTQHYRWDRRAGLHKADFRYWRVVKIVRLGEPLGDCPQKTEAPPKRPGRSWHEPLDKTLRIRGWVCVTNRNIGRKHDERVFFIEPQTRRVELDLTGGVKRAWRRLIEDYREIHEDKIQERKKRNERCDQYLGPEQGRTAFSRHVCSAEKEKELTDGTFCYARLSKDGKTVEALFPVCISRELYRFSPWDLLDGTLRPAENIRELSPADRVFGWVRPKLDLFESRAPKGNEPAAFKGLLRVGPVRCVTPVTDAVQRHPEPIPLAILSSPKPQQGRFYVAEDKSGTPQKERRSKEEAGYNDEKRGLRGRKVYPHHKGLEKNDAYWSVRHEKDARSPDGRWRNFLRPEGKQDSQNFSIKGWVKIGTQFEFDIHFTNLSKVELGALLWLLKLPEGYYLRFGGGKPLGFGSVRLELVDSEIYLTEELKSRYRSWCHPKSETSRHVDDAVQSFRAAVERVYGEEKQAFEEVSFIKAFLRACKGFDTGYPVHYPRTQQKPMDESYRWFVENERGTRCVLGALADDPGLPLLPRA